MKRILILTIFILLFSTIVLAVDPVEVSIKAVSGSVMPTGEAVFNVLVKNNRNIEDTFSLYADPLYLVPFSDSFEYANFNKTLVTIKPFSSEMVELRVKTTKYIMPNRNFVLNFFVKSYSNSEVRADEKVTIGVIRPEKSVIVDVVTHDASPGENVEVTLSFRNVLSNDFNEAEVYINSDFFEFSKEMRIAPHQERTDVFVIPVSKIGSAGSHEVSVRVYDKQILIGELKYNLDLKSMKDVVESISYEKNILNKIVIIKETNNGNEAAQGSYNYSVCTLKKMIMRFDPAPTLSNNNLVWNFELGSGESYTITIEENYNSALIILILILLFVFLLFFWFKKDVSVTKKILKAKGERNDGRIKIMIVVKNRTRKPFRNVKVVDNIPNVIKPAGDYGTLEPTKKYSGERIKSLLWTIPVLDAKEERILTYRIEPAMHILGETRLPSTLAVYHKNDKEHHSKSNTIRVLF